eukprot:CAMPEP_0202104162 /NCGR_PEP_ID=MMETSP0965-20130614/5310_1 /ASSEMBLY_ACC=CAM_ASM_000507 /TAXON_ID=4773 /ORGANISM="Schizochytrium aggregatum, Strain ATCC28209" /LENGTH=86 /DNA_ID=CAMNT_0048673005 /DNA_START=76 /DNA_END=333 /DNA_ORIENTATION=-
MEDDALQQRHETLFSEKSFTSPAVSDEDDVKPKSSKSSASVAVKVFRARKIKGHQSPNLTTETRSEATLDVVALKPGVRTFQTGSC